MSQFFNVYIGPMFGSKTTRLLGDVDRLKHRGRNILAVKPNVDIRYSHENISSHNGGTLKAHSIVHAEEIYTLIRENMLIRENTQYSVIAVDEAFMIEGVDKVLIDLYKSNDFSIVVSSIQMDAGEVPFDNIKNILPYATKIEVCPAVCTMCDQDAYHTKALFDIENATQEEKIGSKDMYEPRCKKHYT